MSVQGLAELKGERTQWAPGAGLPRMWDRLEGWRELAKMKEREEGWASMRKDRKARDWGACQWKTKDLMNHRNMSDGLASTGCPHCVLSFRMTFSGLHTSALNLGTQTALECSKVWQHDSSMSLLQGIHGNTWHGQRRPPGEKNIWRTWTIHRIPPGAWGRGGKGGSHVYKTQKHETAQHLRARWVILGLLCLSTWVVFWGWGGKRCWGTSWPNWGAEGF